MTVWENVENEDCYAVAIYNYSGRSERGVPHLPLEVGELVCVERRCAEWYWGRSLRRELQGAFPRNYVVVRECTVDRCDDAVLASAGGTGVVHEIALTLREWLQHWKILYTSSDQRFTFMEVSMRTLLELRGELASGALPQDQLRRLARTATATIDKGDRKLGMELAVRTAGGQLVDPLSMSTYKLNTLHDETNARQDKNMEATPASGSEAGGAGCGWRARGCCVAARVHNFVCRAGGRLELLLSLSAGGGTLTEPLLLRWPTQHAPGPTQVLFTDLNSDIKKGKVYLVCHVVRVGAMDPQNVDHRRSSVSTSPSAAAAAAAGAGGCAASGAGGVRRPCGVAVADVSKYLASEHHADTHIQLPFIPYEKENLDSLVKKVIANKELKDTKHTQGLWVSVQLLNGDLKQVREQHPALCVAGPAVARALGLPDVVLPGDARNDLYVTLAHGAFSRGKLSVELSARVVTAAGRTIPGVISVGAGAAPVNEYTSLVYYHDERPRWQETFKVCLGIEEFKEAHLVFLARHRSSSEAKDRAERPFCLAYCRLMQRDGTTLATGHHHLAVYKIEYKRATSGDAETEAAAACLGLFERRGELPEGAERGLTRGLLALQPRDSLTVHTALCSTKLTQREEILGVLKWHTRRSEGTLRGALQRLLHVPSEELVKFLQDILDALAQILTQVEETGVETEESVGVLVLDGIVRVISLVLDHKYQHFLPVLHHYLDHSFCDALAYEKLLPVLEWVVLSCERGDNGLKRLLQCMKCLECLMRLVVRSRQLRATLEQHDAPAQHTFNMLLENFLQSLVWLMRRGSAALTCQGSALKYLPLAVPHLVNVYSDTALCSHVVSCLSALPLQLLAKQRVSALLALLRGPLAEPGPRRLLLPHAATTVATLLRDDQENVWRAGGGGVGKAARLLGADYTALGDYRQQRLLVELCVEALGEMVETCGRCGGEAAGEGGGGDRAELVRLSLPTVLRAAADMMRDHRHLHPADPADPLLRRTVCVLLDMIRQMSVDQYSAVVTSLEREAGAAGGGAAGGEGLVAEALALLRALLQRPVFRPHWADMLHLQHHVMMHALRLVSGTLVARLEGEGEGGLRAWREWFAASSELATSPPLQLEASSAARRRRQVALYGDLRLHAATAIRDMWHLLGPHKSALIKHVVGPFLEVSFVRATSVRDVMIPLFYDMCAVERERDGRGDAARQESGALSPFESALVERLDALVSRGCGSAAWRDCFVQRAPPSLRRAAAQQLDVLLEYREAHETQTHYRMHLTVKVLKFYKEIGRTSLYVRYVHKLAGMHRAAAQWAEAALALRLHADLLAWTDDVTPDELLPPAADDLPSPPHLAAAQHRTTQRALKESLYVEVVELLQRGRQWEVAVDAVKELVALYEEEALGYAPLAELHARLSGLYEAMRSTPRQHPGYFRVLYHGRGFPQELLAPHGFVYRGNEFEQLSDFKERLLDEWPRAEVLARLDPPTSDVTLSYGQYVQINAVEPVMGDKLKRVSGRPVAEQVLQYCRHNHVDRFTFCRPHTRPEASLEGEDGAQNEFATRWLERTELTISDKLPGILRWFPVTSAHTCWVSPLEGAVEAMRESNRVLRALVMDVQRGLVPEHTLTMRLNGILDPAVQGGIVNYERAFLSPRYVAAHPDHAPLLAELRDLIATQVPLLECGLQVHGARVSTELEGLHAHMRTCFNKMRDHVYHLYGRKSCDLQLEPEPEVHLRRSVVSRGESDPGTDVGAATPLAARVSDITGLDSTGKSKFFNFNSAPFNPLARYSGAGGGYFSTLQSSPKRRNKRHARKSEVSATSVGGGSQWYTSHNGSASAAPPAACVLVASPATTPPVRELRQELVTARPPRVEAERRLSQRASTLLPSGASSNRDSLGTTDSNQEEEEPPPLPAKCRPADAEHDTNNNDEGGAASTRYNYDVVSLTANPTPTFAPRGSFLYNSIASRRAGAGERAPTPPPKKKNNNKH